MDRSDMPLQMGSMSVIVIKKELQQPKEPLDPPAAASQSGSNPRIRGRERANTAVCASCCSRPMHLFSSKLFIIYHLKTSRDLYIIFHCSYSRNHLEMHSEHLAMYKDSEHLHGNAPATISTTLYQTSRDYCMSETPKIFYRKCKM